MNQPTKHYLWQHITDMKWKFWWKPVRSVGLPGDPWISSKSSPPRISLVCFSSALPSLYCFTVWFECFLCLVFFSPSSFFALPNVHVLYGSFPQPWLNPNWASVAQLHLLSEPFLSRAERTIGASFPVTSGAPNQSCSAIGQVLGWVVVTHIHTALYPYPRGCWICAFCVWTRASVGPIPLDGTWIFHPALACSERLHSAFPLFSQWQGICSHMAKLSDGKCLLLSLAS